MAWWCAPLPPRAVGLAALMLAGGCGDRPPPGPSPQRSAGVSDASTGVGASTAAPTPAATRSTERGRAHGTGAPADEGDGSDGRITLDLGPAGDAWVGATARAPQGATISGDGAGGALIVLGHGRIVTLSTSRGAIAEHRLGAAAAARATDGTLTFTSDTPQAIAYEVNVLDVDGRPLVTRGFATTVPLGRGSVVCACAAARGDADLATARAVCASLGRR